MFRPLTLSHRRAPRRGTAILLTCFSLITLLMVAGLTFVMYAAKEKALAERYKEAANTSSRLTPDPTGTMNKFLGSLIYDEQDDGLALTNSLRGHSIARSMYGGRRDASPIWAGSTVPWAGVGTFSENAAAYTADGTNPYPSLALLPDRKQYVNHTLLTVDNRAIVIDPEWTGNRFAVAGVLPAFAASQGTRAYVGKHAGYTYPDLKNFFLGARDPATGEVLVQSFHRDWLFGSLAPTNPNWSNATGKFLTLRPRPAEHPGFPRVPRNPDGSYTGDVQNLPGAVGVQRPDSLWMHIGLPPITLEDGRVVQPMVAPLILPLDGSFDLSKHGNTLAAGGTGAHYSHGGYGPWEVNMLYGLDGTAMGEVDRQALIANRGTTTAGQPPRTAFDPYAPNAQFPSYSPVAWNGTATTFALPVGNDLSGQPARAGYQDLNTVFTPHPAGHNSNEFTDRGDANPNSPVYPHSDLKRLGLRYAFTPDWHLQAFSARMAGVSLAGNAGTYPFNVAPGATISPSNPGTYRLDPAHTRRNLFTTKSFSLDRPALTPNFVSRDGTNALAMGGPGGPTKPGLVAPVAYPGPTTRGVITDFAADNQWHNIQAALGSVNLNRPLADYRLDTSLPLSTANAGNAPVAEADRQQLAKDIFARFVVALGAAGQVGFDPVQGVVIALPQPGALTLPGVPTPFTQSQYDALRYLAQLAVNIVDYIDNDDVSTTFVWNPSGNPATDFSAAEIGNRVVFGVEKPRLLLNEVYAETTNAPTDPVVDPDPMGVNRPLPNGAQAHVKFWAELVNPTNNPHTNPNGILGDGSVGLNAYQIQIGRATRVTGVAVAQDLATFLSDNANSTGVFGQTADATFTFPAVAPVGTPARVSPNNNQYAPAALPANGFVLVGPPTNAKMPVAQEFNPPAAGAFSAANKVQSGVPGPATTSNAMGYTITMPGAATLSTAEFKRHIVLLRRLANPYLPAGPTNPYITVDYMDYVPAFDAVHRAAGDTNDRGARAAGNAGGYDPVAERFSVGKVQPLAGFANATLNNNAGNYNSYDFATSMVLRQTAAPALPIAPTNPNEPRNTLGRHNGNAGLPAGTTVNNPGGVAATINDTIFAPFDWLIHMDRPLESIGDVLHAHDSKPHRLTQEFVVNTTTGLNYEQGKPRMRFLANGLARGMEMLTVKPHDDRVAHGGRIQGKINTNVMQDRRVALGLLDPQATNAFDANFVNNNVWTTLVGTRSTMGTRTAADNTTAFQVPVPGPSIADTGTGGDRPFYSLGAPAAAAAPGAFAYATGGTIDQTILRRSSDVVPPHLFNAGRQHEYLQSEPYRKIANNITTVSHSFVVYVTIGYFDVTYPGAPAGWPTNVPVPPQFGAEVYDKVPGDMRQKYMAVVDMSNMALKPTFPAFVGDTNPQATERPFFTSLTATARPVGPSTPLSIAYTRYDATNPLNPILYVMADGVERPIAGGVGMQLVIGYGTDTQIVTVDSVTGPGTLSVSGMTRTAWAGTCVSNVRPGYAGPQPGFNAITDQYKPVVPYIERLR
jgi:hypothetical protein